MVGRGGDVLLGRERCGGTQVLRRDAIDLRLPLEAGNVLLGCDRVSSNAALLAALGAVHSQHLQPHGLDSGAGL